MLWQLFPSYLLITILAVVAITWYSTGAIRHFYSENASRDLQARAMLIADQIAGHIGDRVTTDSLCDRLGSISSTRITVVLPSGEMIGDSEEDAASSINIGFRPEIRTALLGGVGQAIRYEQSIRNDLMYLAVPLKIDTAVVGAVRISSAVTFGETLQKEIRTKIVFGGIAIVILAAAVSFYVARRISRPIEHLRRAADRFAQGHLHRTLLASGSDEIRSLAEAMNRMASDLDDRIRAVVQQMNEKEAILSSMSEGVIAVDADERVISMNSAAVDLLGIHEAEFKGMTVHEVVRNADFQRLVSVTLSQAADAVGDIVFRGKDEKFIQCHSTVLKDVNELSIGALIVLNDVSQVRKLEKVRRDFVANVSHELKTPITSIKGFVETLLDRSPDNIDEVRRFLRIIGSQADRLDAIIEDLLSLSRIEQEAERSEISLESNSVKDILFAAIQACEVLSSAKSIRIELRCPDDLTAKVNPPLLEQAIVNLIDNAIKYSDSETTISVHATESESSVIIGVSDQGIGIPEEHHPRLFERFYRVDKARTRKLGGTGLGLAIVKHIALAHGGQVSVQSQPGRGSTFRIHLPRA
jgi:two-component system phosphate regulon sensor histidine kinase PhoR